MQLNAATPEGLKSIAARLLSVHHESRVFAIYGAMGAGKTTFIKYLGKELRVTGTVISPSFTIINEYATSNGGSIYHFDFYRLKDTSEFLSLGCEDYFYSGSYCFIEWPEKAKDMLPLTHVPVYITEENGLRSIEF